MKISKFSEVYSVPLMETFEVKEWSFNEDKMFLFKGCLNIESQSKDNKFENFCGVMTVKLGGDEFSSEVKLASIYSLSSSRNADQSLKFETFSP